MPCVLRLSQFKDNAIQEQAMVALSLLGYVKPPKGRGVRVLCLDGGGTRWVNESGLVRYFQSLRFALFASSLWRSCPLRVFVRLTTPMTWVNDRWYDDHARTVVIQSFTHVIGAVSLTK